MPGRKIESVCNVTDSGEAVGGTNQPRKLTEPFAADDSKRLSIPS
eukprot:XP_001706514.1 Hypothetical protein GL50803_37526 [Giardia lamblia ATCC 50803]